MHFLRLSMRNALSTTRARPIRIAPSQLQRSFTAHTRLYIKEDADRNPEELEQHKQDHLKKQEKGEGKWDRNLASAGEEGIRADHDTKNVGDHDEHMEDLQKQTAQKSEEEHPHGKAE